MPSPVLAVGDMGDIITNVTSWVTAAAGFMSSFATTVASTPVLLLTVVAVPLTGVGIGLFKRAIRA